MRPRTIIGALLLIGVSVVLGATVFREPVAWAAQSVDATIIGPLDGGNVRVHEEGTANVQVVNSASSPLIVQDPEARHQPWHRFLGPGDEYVVPAGKRLVIEYVNGIAQLFGSAQPDWTLSVLEGATGQGYHFRGESLHNCTDCYVMSQALRLYAPAGSTVRIGSIPVGSELRLSGYLLDTP